MDDIFKCESGLRILVVPMQNTRALAMGVFVGTGSMMEAEGEEGISHFIEHMVFKGTERRSSFEIVDELESLGIQINAYTTKNTTVFYTVSIDEHADKCADMLSDILFNATFAEKDIDSERGVVLEEIKMCEDDPEDLVGELLSEAHYGKAPIAKPILGNEKSLATFDKAKILAYMEKRYTADNTVVVIAGNVKKEDGIALASEYFDRFGSRLKAVGTPVTRTAPVGGFRQENKNIKQANISFGFNGCSFMSEEQTAQSFLNIIFGSAMSSRLFQAVREKLGLAYSVYSLPLDYADDGYFTVYLGTSVKKAKKAVEAIREEILKLKRDGITEKELSSAREQLKAAYVLGAESASAVMRLYGKAAILKNAVYDSEEKIKAVNKVTVEDVKRAIDNCFDFDKASAAYVGKKLGFNPLTVLREGK